MPLSPQNPRPIVITGAGGFIGRVLASHATRAGHSVVPLSRGDGTVHSYEDAAALARAFAGADAVVHLAARAHRGGTDADFECNVRVTRAVAEAARTARIRRLVLLSSIGVNGNVTAGKPFDENDTPAPVEPYARSKLRCEQTLRSLLDGTSTQWVIARPPLVYGPNAPGNFGRLVRAVARGVPLPLQSVHNERSLIGAGNLADALLACATHPEAANELFLLADDGSLSTPEIIRAIAQGLERQARLWSMPPSLIRWAAQLAGRQRIAESLCDSLRVDASKAWRKLGWSPAVRTTDGVAAAAAAWKTP